MWGCIVHEWPIAAAVLLFAAGCACSEVFPLPSAMSSPPVAQNKGLLAGFGRADITTPPGFALNGNGPETRQSYGYRHHLFARALVLEDNDGETIAFLVTDLSHLSPLLQRVTADTLAGRGISLGADRFILASTHTHSAPGNFYGASQYNEQGSSLPGYDEAIVAFLVRRFADAVETAYRSRTYAKAGWGAIDVKTFTRNRSFVPFLENDPPTIDLTGAVSYEDSLFRAVDTKMTMLRVDQCNDMTRTICSPTGAFSIFAVHGTGNPSTTDVLDGDVHALAERALEGHIDAVNGSTTPGYKTAAFHLMANGAEGDVSPVHDSATRCERLGRFTSGSGPGGPLRPPPPEEWTFPEEPLQRCMAFARKEVYRVGTGIGQKAIQLFNQLGGSLSDNLPIQRAFATYELVFMSTQFPLCDEPRVGVSSAGGSFEDGRTRVYDMKVLGIFPTHMAEGGKAARGRPNGCHEHKKPLLGRFQGLLVKKHSLPAYVQLSVVQIGSTLIAAVPAEVTSVAGLRMRQELMHRGPSAAERAVVMGLSNGYLQYITTREEYKEQFYEGGSTLYGPNSMKAFQEQLGLLARSIADGTNVGKVDPIVVKPGGRTSYFRKPDEGPPATEIDRRFVDVRWEDMTLVSDWIDVYPGRLRPSDGLVLEIQKKAVAGPWKRIAWDDRHDVEIRAKTPMGRKGYQWELRYETTACPAGDSLRVELYSRPGSPQAVTSAAIACR